MIDPDLARLALLPQSLRDEGYDTPPYRTIRDAAIDGGFDARRLNGLWYYDTTRVAEIAQQLRLKRRPAPIDHSESQSVATA
jgi:hypothetical protein